MIGTIRSARAAGFVGCSVCGRAARPGVVFCERCHARLPSTGRRPLSVVYAWLIAGIVLYIPANTLPMLVSSQFGKKLESTIIGGAIDLLEHGSYAVALIVLVASVLIPIAKFAAIIWLCVLVQGTGPFAARKALHLYEVVEFIGRWSMIDVFVVAILAALVQLGFLASLAPGAAAAFFALSVATTMLAARAFDSRMIWDRIEAAK